MEIDKTFSYYAHTAPLHIVHGRQTILAHRSGGLPGDHRMHAKNENSKTPRP